MSVSLRACGRAEGLCASGPQPFDQLWGRSPELGQLTRLDNGVCQEADEWSLGLRWGGGPAPVFLLGQWRLSMSLRAGGDPQMLKYTLGPLPPTMFRASP